MPFFIPQCHFNIMNSFFFYLSGDKGLAISQVIVLNKLFILARYLTVKQALEAGNTLLLLSTISGSLQNNVFHTLLVSLIKVCIILRRETGCCSYRNSADSELLFTLTTFPN